MKINKKSLLSIALTLLTPTIYAKDIAIIDAGSSGSRIYFYSYQNQSSNLLPVLKQVSSNSVKPGLSSFVSDPNSAKESIKTLIDYNNLNSDEQNADIYLMATAGMRLVDKTDQDKIYSAIKQYLSNDTKMHVRQVGTISGEWEGVYDWISVNYLKNSLTSKQEPNQTYGVLDMGGASTQIAYASNFNKENTLPITLGGNTFNINSQSFLGLGLDQAREKYSNNKSCFAVGYPLSGGNQGAGDMQTCAKDAVDLINNVHNVQTITKDIPINMNFFAISGYYYTYHDVANIGDVTPEDLTSSTATQFCSETWDQLQLEHPDNKYLKNLCFNTSYIYSLLTNGYSFPVNKTITVTNKIDDSDIGWNLGAAVYAVASSDNYSDNSSDN